MVVAAIDKQATRQVMQLLQFPPLQGTYGTLKQLLPRRYSLSAAERADKLLSLPDLGDGMAMDLMDNMLSLLGSDEGGFIFPHIFLPQLTPSVCVTLANSPHLASGDYRSLVEKADCVLLAMRNLAVRSVTLERLNNVTTHFHYPIPHIQFSIGRCHYFSKVDLVRS